MKRKYRCFHEIYYQILNICKKPQNLSTIMERCGLSGKTVYQHVKALYDAELLAKIQIPSHEKIFLTTLKGLTYMKLWRKIQKIIEPSSLKA